MERYELKKFGAEVKQRPEITENWFDLVSLDPSPESIRFFDSLEEAKETLKKYENTCQETRGNVGIYYLVTVFAIEVYSVDEDGDFLEGSDYEIARNEGQYNGSWQEFCLENEERIRECLRKMIPCTRDYQQDLYLYEDGSIDYFVNPGGSSWLNDDHVCFFTYPQGFYVDFLEERGYNQSGADDEAILDFCVDDDWLSLLAAAEQYDKDHCFRNCDEEE